MAEDEIIESCIAQLKELGDSRNARDRWKRLFGQKLNEKMKAGGKRDLRREKAIIAKLPYAHDKMERKALAKEFGVSEKTISNIDDKGKEFLGDWLLEGRANSVNTMISKLNDIVVNMDKNLNKNGFIETLTRAGFLSFAEWAWGKKNDFPLPVPQAPSNPTVAEWMPFIEGQLKTCAVQSSRRQDAERKARQEKENQARSSRRQRLRSDGG